MRAAGRRRVVAAVEGQRQEGDRLGVRPGACGVLGGQGGIPARPRPVVGRVGVVGQHGVVARPDLLERVEQPGVQSALGAERDRGAHGATGQLVPEADPASRADEQTGRVEPSQAGSVHAEQRQEPVVDRVRRRRDELEHLEVVVGQLARAGQHGVTHRRGQPTARVATDLTDVEGVSPGEPVDADRVEVGAVEQRAHGVDAERREGDDLRVLQPSQVAEQRAQRVTRADLRVAVGQHEQDGEGVDASHEVSAAPRPTPRRSTGRPRRRRSSAHARHGRDDEGLDVAAGRRRRQTARLTRRAPPGRRGPDPADAASRAGRRGRARRARRSGVDVATRSRLVLPAPASPVTATTCPDRALSRIARRSRASSCSRSKSPTFEG